MGWGVEGPTKKRDCHEPLLAEASTSFSVFLARLHPGPSRPFPEPFSDPHTKHGSPLSTQQQSTRVLHQKPTTGLPEPLKRQINNARGGRKKEKKEDDDDDDGRRGEKGA